MGTSFAAVATRSLPCRLSLLIVTALLLSLGPVAESASARCANENIIPRGPESARKAVKATVCLMNEERSERGIRALRANGDLKAAARKHAQDMDRRNYVSHTSRGSGASPADRARREGYRGTEVHENIALWWLPAASPRVIVDAWMGSRGHRDNILRRSSNDVGVGIRRGDPRDGSRDHAIYVAKFGRS